MKTYNKKSRSIVLFLALGALLISMPFVYRSLTNLTKVHADWYNSAWGYRMGITFGNTGAAVTDQKVLIQYNTASLITANKLQSSCQDIRFTDAGGKLLQYYHNSAGGAGVGCNDSSSDFYVLMPSIVAGNNQIYIYYGNPTALAGTAAANFGITTFSPTSGPTIAGEEQSPGAVAVWRFDEGQGSIANDASGHGNSLTLTSTAWATSSATLSNRSQYLQFNGATSVASRANDTDFNFGTGSFTISAWIRHSTAIVGTDVLIDKYNTQGWKVYMNSSGFMCFGIDDDSSYGPDDSACTTVSYADSQWHHIEVVKVGTTSITVYVDGIQKAQTTSLTATATLSTTASLYIGADSSGATNWWDGWVDDVAIYQYAKTTSQVGLDVLGSSTASGSAVLIGTRANDPLTNGLVGWWKMDESSWTNNCSSTSILDTSGNGNNLASCPNTTGPTGGAIGKFGNAGAFDGADDYLETTSSSLNLSGTITLSAWVYINSAPSGTVMIIDRSNNNAGYYLGYNSSLNPVLRIGNGTSNTTIVGGSAMSTSKWYFLSGTSDASGNMVVYINGLPDGTGTATSGLAQSSGQNFRIGTRSATNYINAKVDDVRMYNRSLSPSDVRQLYNWAPGPVGYWSLNENTGTSGSDISGNGSVMTITNPNWSSGKYGSALRLSSSATNFASAPDNATLSLTGNLTLSAWINPYSVTAATAFPITGKTSSFWMIQYGDEIRVYIGSSSNYVTTNAANLSTNTWYHVAGVYSSTAQTVTIYINGVPYAATVTGTIPASIADGTDTFDIGRSTDAVSGSVSRSVTASSDDAMSSYGSDCDSAAATLTDTRLPFGKIGSATGTCSGSRFTNVTVPNSATITSATYTVTCGDVWTTSNTLAVKVAAQAADNASTFTTSGFDLSTSTRPRTSYTSTWDLKNACANLNDTNQKDVTSQVQAVVNRGGWSSGNALVLITDNDGSTNDEWQYMWSYDDATGQEPQLSIQYSSGSTYYYNGLIDDVSVYNYARTQAQIVEDMNGGHPAGGSPVGSAIIQLKFDEMQGATANNSGYGGSSMNGAISSATWYTGGKLNSAISTATAANFINTGDQSFVDSLTGLTTSFWVKPIALATSKALVTKSNFSNQNSFGIVTDTSTASEVRVHIPTSVSDTGTYFTTSGLGLANDTWSYMTVIYNASESASTRVRVYKNGKPITGSVTGTLPDKMTTGTTSLLKVGASDSGSYTALNAVFDEVKIYPYPLSYDQMLVDYNGKSAMVLGALSTDASGNASSSASRSYCPPGNTETNCASGLNPSPVGYWTTDENTGTTAYDLSGYGNNGTLTGSGKWANGEFGAGFQTQNNATQDYISVGDPASGILDFSNTQDFTYQFWYKHGTTSDAYVVPFEKGGSSASRAGYDFEVNASTLDASCTYTDGNGAGSDQVTWTGSNVLNGNWHYIVCERDYSGNGTGTAGYHMFVDGVKRASLAQASFTEGDGSASSRALVYGEAISSYKNLVGTVDDVRIYKYARTPSQIAWDYNHGGPVGWWKMDEASWGAPNCSTTVVKDSSGGSYNMAACPNSTGPVGGVTGKYNNAVTFDGSNDYLKISSVPSTSLSVSISAWIKWNGTTGSNQSIFSTGDDGGCTGWYLYLDSSVSNALSVVDSCTSTFNTSFTPTTGVWTHLVGVRTGNSGTWTLYANGKSVGSDATFVANAPTTQTSIGSVYNGSANVNVFKGDIDDVRYFNYPLTQHQINMLYNGGAAVKFGP